MPKPVFTDNEDHGIELPDAAAMTKRYRSRHPNGTKGGFFGRAAVEEILGQPDVVGIRYYFAYDADSDVLRVILVGVRENADDVYTGALAEISVVCPDVCGVNNPLNSDV
ncbi:MAG TPA: hypothetical protein VEY71_05505 [Chitinophagales bacterium]|nr:hypothetical protein [Chitinophagales bacterium]